MPVLPAQNDSTGPFENRLVLPSGHLVAMIEALAGEAIWREEDD